MIIPASAFPLAVSGAAITGADGQPYRLCGVNWPGAHQDNRVAAGLDKLPRSEIIGRIVSWGMNHVRFPFATGTLLNRDGTPFTSPVPLARVAANPDLAGLTPWQLMQALVADMTAAGLYVIVNNHLSYPGWCCSDADVNGLWHNDNWPAAVFTACWDTVAAAFGANPRVGYDLRNEPRSAVIGGVTVHPTWGDGNPATDFRRMYQATADRIRFTAPGCLVFCEGLSYATDLTGWAAHPVTGPGVVASLHDYSWFHPGGQATSAYFDQMDRQGGYLRLSGTAPVWVGEFGQDLASRAAMTSGWMANFLAWAGARGVSWCWWSLSAQTVRGTEPGTGVLKAPDGNREGFGLMCGQDWKGTNAEMIALLQDII